ncbi:MAG: hypothetical protein DWQ04_29515 [Chloroflexi bacterium]|nr:MAG: hypothetical protein DWQ04_29515 [Chloroflexota bacterium]
MDASDAQAYVGRWQAVSKLKQLESHPVSPTENWRRLNAIKRRAARLGITRKDDDGEMEIYLLWAKLKANYAPN